MKRRNIYLKERFIVEQHVNYDIVRLGAPKTLEGAFEMILEKGWDNAIFAIAPPEGVCCKLTYGCAKEVYEAFSKGKISEEAIVTQLRLKHSLSTVSDIPEKRQNDAIRTLKKFSHQRIVDKAIKSYITKQREAEARRIAAVQMPIQSQELVDLIVNGEKIENKSKEDVLANVEVIQPIPYQDLIDSTISEVMDSTIIEHEENMQGTLEIIKEDVRKALESLRAKTPLKV